MKTVFFNITNPFLNYLCVKHVEQTRCMNIFSIRLSLYNCVLSVHTQLTLTVKNQYKYSCIFIKNKDCFIIHNYKKSIIICLYNYLLNIPSLYNTFRHRVNLNLSHYLIHMY